jgi:hypothetical protein
MPGSVSGDEKKRTMDFLRERGDERNYEDEATRNTTRMRSPRLSPPPRFLKST